MTYGIKIIEGNGVDGVTNPYPKLNIMGSEIYSGGRRKVIRYPNKGGKPFVLVRGLFDTTSGICCKIMKAIVKGSENVVQVNFSLPLTTSQQVLIIYGEY